MTMHMCDRKEQLIGFLYRELDQSEAHEFEQHLLTCAECRMELGDLRSTRGQIAAWTPPEPDLGFHIIRGAARPAPPARVFRISPAWGLAAAAMLVIAIGAAIAHLEVRVGGGQGFVVRTGWSRTDTAADARVDDSGVQTVDWKQESKRLDERLRAMEQMLASNRSGAVQSASATMTDEAMLQRVRDMLDQSETKQQRMLAARLTEMTREYDARRRIDLVAIDQGMNRLQNTSGAEVRQYRDLIQRMYRATAYQQTK